MSAGGRQRQAHSHKQMRSAGAVEATIRAGAVLYDRARHLPRLIRALPGEIACDDRATAEDIVSRLAAALAAERRRGRAHHWTYDMNRHIALLQALAAEQARLHATCRGADCMKTRDPNPSRTGGPLA